MNRPVAITAELKISSVYTSAWKKDMQIKSNTINASFNGFYIADRADCGISR